MQNVRDEATEKVSTFTITDVIVLREKSANELNLLKKYQT